MSKLTEAQRELLVDLSYTPVAVNPDSRPLKALVRMGYATTRKLRFSSVAEITPEGISALAKEPTP